MTLCRRINQVFVAVWRCQGVSACFPGGRIGVDLTKARRSLPPMTSSGFPGHAARSSSGRLELVHVESGAVLASKVRLDRVATPQHLAWLRGNSAPGSEAAIVLAPARWAHTFFASAPTDVAFVDADGTVLRVRRSMRPWRVTLAFRASGAVQGMPGFLTRTRTRVGDRLTLREQQASRPARDDADWQADFDQIPEAMRAQFRESVDAGLQDTESQVDPWGVEAEEVREDAPAAPPPQVPAPRATPPSPLPESARRREEPARPAAAPKPASRTFSKGVDLATLTDRQTPLEWFEAVAIGQELNAVLLAGRRGAPAPDFEPENVAITAEGSVETHGVGAHALPSVPQVAHILLSLLGGVQTIPVQLRLFALQEVSPTPRCSTLGEYSRQLAVFERPNRQTTIREVYQRFMALPPPPVEEPRAPAAAPSRAPRPRKVRAALWRDRRVRMAAAVGALVVALVFAGWVVWELGAPLASGAGRAGAADGGAPVEKTFPEEAAERLRAAALRIWGAEPPRRAPLPAEVPPGQPAAVPLPRPRPGRAATSPADAVLEPTGGGDVPAVATASAVFSAANADVVPPVLERSRQPATPRTGVRLEDLPEVELVVSPTGEVESVRLVTETAGVIPKMMLSAIKTWHFQPATLDGRPVRYRLRMHLTNQ